MPPFLPLLSPSLFLPMLLTLFCGNGRLVKACCIEARVQPHLQSDLSPPPGSLSAGRIWPLLFIQHSGLQNLLLEFRSLSCRALSLQANNGDLYPNRRTKIKAVGRMVCISSFPPTTFPLNVGVPLESCVREIYGY